MLVTLIFLLTVAIMGAVQAKEVTFEELRNGLNNQSLVYIDVRNRSELVSDGKVVGSVVVPLPELEEAFNKSNEEFSAKYGFPKPAKDATNVVIGCRSGKRAASAIGVLEKLGYSSLKIYTGSFLDWVAKGGAISKE